MAKYEDLREKYLKHELLENQVPNNPFELFQKWMVEAINVHVPEPNAMTLSSMDADGYPQSRVVLLKETTQEGFIFYSNYNSNKAMEMELHNKVSLSFNWLQTERQVRIVGEVEKVEESKSVEYFSKRPRGSQLGAWSSPQSKEIPNRSFLTEAFKKVQEKFEGLEEVQRPDFWGGYIVRPKSIEFWQGRNNRMHDRIKFTKGSDNSWGKIRLAP